MKYIYIYIYIYIYFPPEPANTANTAPNLFQRGVEYGKYALPGDGSVSGRSSRFSRRNETITRSPMLALEAMAPCSINIDTVIDTDIDTDIDLDIDIHVTRPWSAGQAPAPGGGGAGRPAPAAG